MRFATGVLWCEQLGLPPPPKAEEASNQNRVLASFDAAADAEVPRVAERYLDGHCRVANVRNELQEALWALTPGPEIPKRTRHEFALALEAADLYEDAALFDVLLRRLPGVHGRVHAFGAVRRAEEHHLRLISEARHQVPRRHQQSRRNCIQC